MCAGSFLTVVAGVPAATAVQASGDDVTAWQNGYSWTYGSTSFRYQADGTDVTINESVTYTVAGRETFHGHDAYKLNISGSITGGSGSVVVPGTGTATLKNFSGTVGGTRYVRRSDLALLKESQQQHLNATASISIISTGIVADINLNLTPNPVGWKIHDFPLNVGDAWHTLTDVDYDGGFTYDAGSLGGTGSSPFLGTMHFDAPANVTASTVNAMGNGALPVKRVFSQNADATMSDDSYWSPQYKNQAKETLILPLDGGAITLNRSMTSASVNGGTTISATATPSYSCAGGNVVVSGAIPGGSSGQSITATLDQSPINPGQSTSATTTTGAGGSYSVSLPVPAQTDGLAKTGTQSSRADWGIVVDGPAGATGATTVVVTSKDCTTLAYTGAIAGPQTGTATLSAQLNDLADQSKAAGQTVTFALSGGQTVNATTNGSGVASVTIPVSSPVRAATVSASFAGAADMEAASTSTGFAVQAIPTATSVVANPSVQTVGDPIVFNATVAPTFGNSVPSGTVQFVVNGSNFGGAVALSGGTASSAPLSTLPVSLHNSVVAIYSGSADHAAGTSPAVDFRVRNPLLGTTTTVSAVPSTVVAGQPVTLAANVTKNSGSDPLTGSVTFTDGGTTVATVGLDASGHAESVVTDLPVGNHSIVANYSGDDIYAGGASAPAGVSVAKADVHVVLNTADDTTVSGESVNLTATVAAVSPSVGVPSGTVQLVVDGANSGAPVALTGGAATFIPLTSLGAGNHTIAVTYAGNDSYKAGANSLTQLVSPASTTTTVTSGPSPQVEEQPVTITATVGAQAPGSGAPTGNVLFLSDGNVIGAATLAPAGGSAQATLEIDSLAPGTHAITASYPGDSNYVASGSDAAEQKIVAATSVVGTTTTVTSTKNPATYGELISFSAHVAAADATTPTGSVQFSVDGTDIGGPVTVDGNGNADSVMLASPEPGDHLVIAAYTPNAAYALSGDALTQTVSAAGVSLGLTSSNPSSNQGQAVTFHATVTSIAAGTGTPDGFVQFRVDGFAFGPAVALNGDGEATSGANTSLTPGAHTVTAVYSGDGHFVPATKAIIQNVGQMATSTALTASTASPTYGDAVTYTATVTPAANVLGAPTGTIAFVEGTTTLATVPVSAAGSTAKASFTTSAFGAGAHTVKAVYSGATAFAGSTSATSTVTVAKRATTLKADAALIKLTAGLGLNVGFLKATLTTSAGPLAGQPVAFTIGTTTVCTTVTDGAGVATCNALPQLLALTLSGGYKATYAGSANYQGSTDNGTLLK